MNQNKVIGLTGSISTGKSQISNYLKSKGLKLIDTDKIARDVVDIPEVVDKIKSQFGDNLYLSGRLDRKKLASIIFNDDNSREKLNEITHPEIYKIILEEIKNSNEIVFVDIPLLFENSELNERFGLKFDEIWVVYVDRETQVKRLMIRDNIDREYAEKKIDSQIPIERKKELADVIIDNRFDLDFTIKQVDDNLKRLKDEN
ncbi:dephospho-CoA kinase [Peptoniphilus sp. MSJ-1]|uniref:Dephospho-CoA kinase n=1 Tax=Peptoniphilus ovalis TaxID=2841503 RepID=A0ABS6FJI0_9FIRM|nr:dephospho-CoA kinase [Peptoniphilus ovalis]MBU5670136.1 dephospho-CoA kinase [Peptoniphilus ovalis]